MADIVGTLRRLVGRLVGRRGDAGDGAPKVEQIASVVDGASAVALVEACAAEAAGLAASGVTGDHTVSAFEDRVHRHRANLLGRTVSGVDASDARGAIATAVGLAMSGLRSTAFAGASDLQAAYDQLASASARHVPLVVHLGCRAGDGPGAAVGSGHSAYHAVAGAGAVQLFASNVQEAVDLSLVARRVTEQTLVPVVVAVDWEQTARSTQNVQLPSAALVRAYLGLPSDAIESPTPAQRMLFGDRRRRVPRWFDLERPVMHGAVLGPESFGAVAAGRRAFFAAHVPDALSAAFTALSELTGRPCGDLREHALDRSEVLLVAQGAAVETAIAVADHMRTHDKRRVGVLGVAALRPLPRARLGAALTGGAQRVVVLERTASDLGPTPPLTGEVLAALHTGTTSGSTPQVVSGIYGVGGLPLRARDVRAIALAGDESPTYLGVEFAPRSKLLPKRQTYGDTVRRDYPEVESLQQNGEAPLALTPPDGFVAGVLRTQGGAGAQAARIAATTLGMIGGGHVRATSGTGWERWGRPTRDAVAFSPSAVPAVGDETQFDACVVCEPIGSLLAPAAEVMRRGGVVVLATARSVSEVLERATAETLKRMAGAEASVFRLAGEDGDSAVLRDERIAGALMSTLVFRKRLEATRSSVLAARGRALEDIEPAERDVRLAAFTAGFDDVEAVSLTGEAGRKLPRMMPPAALTHLQPRDESAAHAYDSLSEFWNQVGVLYERTKDVTPSLSADPILAGAVVPPLSAVLRGERDTAETLPKFVPDNCTGCGRCWTQCPDGAIAPAAYRPKELFEAGLGLAKAKHRGVDALRPMLGKLGPIVSGFVRDQTGAPTAAGALIAASCGSVLDAAPLPEERKKPIIEAFQAVTAALGDLPLARTKPLFDDPEATRAGDGALLTLAIDPNVCKGCRACVAACHDDALVAEARAGDHLEATRVGYARWQRLPDTAGDIIAAARDHDTLGDLPALLLSRHCALATSGADGVEPGSGARLAIRLVMAAGEFQLQRQLQALVGQVTEQRNALAGLVQRALQTALPTADLDALAGKLASVSGDAASLADLASADDGVDVARSKRLVDTARALDDLIQRITEGPFGLGRSRLGLVIAPDPLTEGVAAYPYNPFQVPTLVDATGEAAALARGALEGQLRAVGEDLALLDRAAQLAKDPGRVDAPDTRNLTWAEMTAEQRATCPPMVLIGGSGSFTDRALSRLLDTDLPVVVVLLSDGVGDGATAHWAGRSSLGALSFGLANPDVFVLQSSLAYPGHLGRGLLRAFAHGGPALIHLHTPSPAHHGFASDRSNEQARLAVTSRAFPLLVFDPTAEGVFGTHVSLDGNPVLDQPWCEHDDGLPMTPAHWAATEGRFAAWFADAAGYTGRTVPLHEHLARGSAAGTDAVPVIGTPDGAKTVSAEAVSMCQRRQREWRVLGELAGLVTPFTERVKREAQQEVAQSHATELEQLRDAHAQKLAALRDELRNQTAAQVRDRLMLLAGYGRDNVGDESR